MQAARAGDGAELRLAQIQPLAQGETVDLCGDGKRGAFGGLSARRFRHAAKAGNNARNIQILAAENERQPVSGIALHGAGNFRDIPEEGFAQVCRDEL